MWGSIPNIFKGKKMGKLPIWGTVQHSFGFCFSNLGSMMRLASVPILLVIAIAFVVPQPDFTGLSEGARFESGTVALILIANILSFIVTVQFVTAWHRQFLSDGGQPRWFAFSFGGRELRYILMTILTTLVIIAALIIPIILVAFLMFNAMQSGEFSALGVMAIPIVWGLSIFLWARFSMVLPAAAIGAPAGLKDSWRATKGSVLRIAAVQILMVLIIIIPLAIIMIIFMDVMVASMVVQAPEGALEAMRWFFIILSPVQLLVTAIIISSLSAIYKFLSERDDTEVQHG